MADRRYLVVGAGAVGVSLAAQLSAAGRDVVVVARGAQLAALQSGELRYVRPDGVTHPRLTAVEGPEDVELIGSDVLVLAVKSQDADAVLAAWASRPVGRPDGEPGTAGDLLPVVTLQNGLSAERDALRRFRTVLGAVVATAASYVQPGEVVAAGAPDVGHVWLGLAPAGTSPVATAVAEDLTTAGYATQLVEDVSAWKAGKLTLAVTFALDALYAPSPLRDRAADLLRAEARTVLEAAGHRVADLVAESILDPAGLTVRAVPGHERGTSVWQSLGRASSLEVDHLNGEVVLQARLLGRGAPVAAAVTARVHRAADEGTAPRSLGDDDLLALLPALAPADGTDVLVDAAGLAAALAGSRPPVLLDVRWALGDPHGREHHAAGHLPGAAFVDLDNELAGHGMPTDGRHPLPDPADLQAAARRWGVRADSPVVVYDDSGGLAAARAWWLLRWAGLTDVRLLDGGLGAWRAADLPVETGPVQPAPGDVELGSGLLPTLTADDAAALARSGVLLDARAAERYAGDVEPVDPRAGHVPGARSAPTGGNLAGGAFAPADRLRERFAALGVTPDTPVGAYCGSGVTAAHQVAALRIAGIDAALYPGSWSAWSNDPDRPLATGSLPG